MTTDHVKIQYPISCFHRVLFQHISQEINAINNILLEHNIDLIDNFKLSTEYLQKRAEEVLLEAVQKIKYNL